MKKPIPSLNRPLRILMLSWEYPPNIVGGLGRHVGELSLAMAQAGMQIDVVTANTPDEPAIDTEWPPQSSTAETGRLVIHRAPPDPINPLDFVTSIHQLNFGMLQRIIGLTQSADQPPFDLIHAHDWLAVQASWVLKQSLGIPLVCTIHATEHGRQHGIHTPLQSYINGSEWLLTYEAARVICCSQFMAKEVTNVLSVPVDKTHVIPNGIDPKRMRLTTVEKADLQAFRQRWADPDEKLAFFVGRMVPEKGAQVLIDAALRVLSTWPKMKVVIAGGGQNAHLIAQTTALGLSNRILFPGFVTESELRKFYAVADVAVFPSLYEPFGIVALEAMAAGVPVITSDVGGFTEIIRSGENGLTSEANNPDSLAGGILDVLRNPQYAQSRIQVALNEIDTIYSWENIGQQTLAVYQEVLTGWIQQR
jgi:glycogen synthase